MTSAALEDLMSGLEEHTRPATADSGRKRQRARSFNRRLPWRARKHASANQDFVYADCTLNNKQFELHVDVGYQGTSGALHEVDESVCDHRHADAVRRTSSTPKGAGNKLCVVFECKFYESTPGVSLGRTFVGLVSDCGSLRLKGFSLKGFISNIPSDKLRQYFSKTSRPKPYLGINPTDSAGEDRFVRNVEQVLRKWS